MANHPISYDQIALFEGIAPGELDSLLPCLHHHTQDFRKGSYIFVEQDHVQNVGIVLSGSVHMLKEDVWGNQTLIAHIGPGELFGETFALRKQSHSYVSYLAARDTKVLFLSMENLLHPCPRQCPFHVLLSQNMYDLLGKKNIQLMERIEVSAKTTLRDKLLAYLSLQAQKQESEYFTVPLNRSEMASFLQSNRSAMTRELNNMRDEGLIDFDGNTFTLKA